MTKLSSRRLAVAFVSAASIALIAGCGEPSADAADDSENTGTQQSALFEGGTCPGRDKAIFQRKVTAVVNYALGGNVAPLTLYPCTGPSKVKANIESFRAAIADGSCTLGPAGAATVCGIPASQRLIECSGSELTAISQLGAELDACWGVGASGFLHSAQAGRSTYIDPEPVQLTQSLTGSNGATAAAVYVNSNTDTSVVKWYSTPVYNPSLAAGTPCSTTDLSSATQTYKTIQALGNYRKCI